MGDGRRGGNRQASDDREDGCEGNGGDDRHEHGATQFEGQQRGGGVRATRRGEDAVRTNQSGGAEAQDERHEVESTDDDDGPGHGAASFLRSRNRVEAHEDVRESTDTEDEGDTEGDEVNLRSEGRAVLQARLHNLGGLVALLRQVLRASVRLHRAIEEGTEATLDGDEDHGAHRNNTGHKQDGLNHLHVGRALHAADEDVDNHEDAHDTNDDGLPEEVVDVEQDRDQGAGAGHLRDEVEQRDEERRNSGGHADRLLLETEAQHISHGEATHVTQRLSHEHERHEPCDEEAHGVQEAVVTGERDGADDTKEGRGGQVVTGDGEAVLAAREGAATGVEV